MTFVGSLPRAYVVSLSPQFKSFSLIVPGFVRQVQIQYKLHSIIPYAIQNLIDNYFIGRSPNEQLITACITQNISHVKNALFYGANPLMQLDQLSVRTISPMIVCAINGNLNIALELIKHCDNIENFSKLVSDKMEPDGSTPLHYAAANNNPEICNLLLSHNCDVNSKDCLGRTPLMEAANVGSLKCIKMLLHYNANVNSEDNQNYTALSYVLDGVQPKYPRFMQCAVLLIVNGANPNYKGMRNKHSILHYAVMNGDEELVHELVEIYNAVILVYNEDNRTPIYYAHSYRFDKIENYLKHEHWKSRDKKKYWISAICCLLYFVVTIIAILLFAEIFSSDLAVNVSVGIILIICGIVFCVVALFTFCDADEGYDIDDHDFGGYYP